MSTQTTHYLHVFITNTRKASLDNQFNCFFGTQLYRFTIFNAGIHNSNRVDCSTTVDGTRQTYNKLMYFNFSPLLYNVRIRSTQGRTSA